jgi:hypothetical protein
MLKITFMAYQNNIIGTVVRTLNLEVAAAVGGAAVAAAPLLPASAFISGCWLLVREERFTIQPPNAAMSATDADAAARPNLLLVDAAAGSLSSPLGGDSLVAEDSALLVLEAGSKVADPLSTWFS